LGEIVLKDVHNALADMTRPTARKAG